MSRWAPRRTTSRESGAEAGDLVGDRGVTGDEVPLGADARAGVDDLGENGGDVGARHLGPGDPLPQLDPAG